MSAVTVGTLAHKRRIPASESPLTFRAGYEFIVDNGGTINLNDYIDGLNTFPHPGARTFTVGTPTFNQGTPIGTPLTRDGDVLTLTEIPYDNSAPGGVEFGIGSVEVTLSLAGTHDFDPVPNVQNFGKEMVLVHDASDSAFNGGSATMRFDGTVDEWICPAPFTGFRCADIDPFAP